MSKSQPYQPLLLRILHGINGLVALLAILTSFWVYNLYDGRIFKLPLPQIPDIIGIHGTFGLMFLIIFPALALYSFHLGERCLIQSDSWTKLTKIGKPIWWYTLHRIINTLLLLAGTFALITGRNMKEEWLPESEFNQTWYQLHLLAWLILLIGIIIHILMSIKVGGIPLILSMFNKQYRSNDTPQIWWQNFKQFIESKRGNER